METRKLLNARVCRLGWERDHANHHQKQKKKKGHSMRKGINKKEHFGSRKAVLGRAGN